MDISHTRFQLESSKENLFQTILENKENLDTETIAKAIKEFVKNYNKYDNEKKNLLDVISKN
ncbi:hypothetical protein [Nitrosopumilus sp.]|uniref:hypothetical protein n=1 Tax=Nitrosopumilus sp. TaxID=2024843 RepID=UPI0026195CF0|nr:hypothetical protein [Nitrosopumilus sp.]